MQNLVYAEVSVTFQMLEDKQVVIILDMDVFIVTTEENSKNYDEELYPVDVERMEAYEIDFIDGRVGSKVQLKTE